jgi:hypothetical protein
LPVTFTSKAQSSLARISRISAHARCSPIHDRGPVLNGCMTFRWSL